MNEENNQNQITLSDVQLTPQVADEDVKKELRKTRSIMRQFGIEIAPEDRKPGLPTVMTPDTLEFLAEAWMMGCSDEEACTYAGIHPATLYNFQKGRDEFLEYKEHLKRNPILKARMTLYKALGDPSYAWKFLQKKTIDLRDDDRPNVQLNFQLNQLVEQDRRRIDEG